MNLLIIIAFLYSLYLMIGYWDRKRSRDLAARDRWPSARIRRIVPDLDEAEKKISE